LAQALIKPWFEARVGVGFRTLWISRA